VNPKQRCLPSGSDTSIWPGGWSLCLPPGDVAADLVDVQVSDGLDDLLQRGSRQRAGLGGHPDAVT